MNRSEIREGTEINIDAIGIHNKSISENRFLSWRTKFLTHLESLGIYNRIQQHEQGSPTLELTKPDTNVMANQLGQEAVERSHNYGDQLIFPVSGDTDSSALVMLMAKGLQQSPNAQNINIRAFHLDEGDPKRITRLNRLFDFINAQAQRELVSFDVFDMNETKNNCLNDLYRSANLDSDSHFRRGIIVEHHLIDIAVGHLTSKYRTSFVCKGQTFTEIAANDFPMADMRATWHPGFFIPKSSLTYAFDKELKATQNPQLQDMWYPINHRKAGERHIYQSGMKLQQIGDPAAQGLYRISRRPHNIEAFTSVDIDIHRSTINPDFMKYRAERVGEHEGIMSIDQAVLAHLDPYFVNFMAFGLSPETTHRLEKMFPNQEGDIRLAAILNANARDHYTKNIDMLSLMARV